MNKFVTFLSLFSIFFCASDCVDFCNVKTMDNVWNVGHFIYITRCGEVWTFDPRMRNGVGDFIRDYSWFAFARNSFGKNIATTKDVFENKFLHFAAFSFNEIQCEPDWYNPSEECDKSALQWNGLSVIADNRSAITFRFETEIIFRNDSNNPFGFPAKQDLFLYDRLLYIERLPFWPNLRKLAPEFKWKQDSLIHSTLFFREDYRLFMALLSPDKLYFCITHLNMKSMLLDVREWPNRKEGREDFDWAPPYCFTGNVVGMFSKEGEAYVVGRVLYDNRQYEDQVYIMDAEDGSKVEIIVVNIPGFSHPHNLRTFFGCDVDEPFRIYTTTTTTTTTPFPTTTGASQPTRKYRPIIPRPPGLPKHPTPPTDAPHDFPLVPPTFAKVRQKRWIEKSQQIYESIWTDITTELSNDWILLSLMSFTALFMILIIFRLRSN